MLRSVPEKCPSSNKVDIGLEWIGLGHFEKGHLRERGDGPGGKG